MEKDTKKIDELFKDRPRGSLVKLDNSSSVQYDNGSNVSIDGRANIDRKGRIYLKKGATIIDSRGDKVIFHDGGVYDPQNNSVDIKSGSRVSFYDEEHKYRRRETILLANSKRRTYAQNTSLDSSSKNEHYPKTFNSATRKKAEREYVFKASSESVDDYLFNQFENKYAGEGREFVLPVGQIKNQDEILIKLRDVRIGFKRGATERVVIEHLSLDIKRGEILGLVGESGSGKTTVGRAILRVNSVSGGVITYNNVPISGKVPKIRERALKTKVQMVFQDPAASLNERANVDYIISEGLRAFRMYDNEQDRLDKISKMIQKVGLRPEHLTRYPHEFSGGQRQRIGIARCMVMNPEFVIADEPISALDVSIRAQVLNLLKEFQKESNMTILFIAHDLSVVRYISDRIAVIYAGKIVELCEANELFKNPLHPYTKALLSAVPIPDPAIESKKLITTYSPAIHGYTKEDKVDLREVSSDHFVRASEKELIQYKETLAKRNGGKN